MSMYKFNFNIKQKKVDVNTNKAINVKSVKEHNKLENLDYEHSGHTGFASQKELEALSKKVMTDDERTKLSGIDPGAQVNKIESIKVNGTEVKPNSNKEVNIPVDASGAAEKAVSTHNSSSTAHSDIRTLVSTAQTTADNAQTKANKIEELIVKNGVIDGSPKGVYASLSALQTAFPSGASGVYLTSNNGHWYYWNGSAWTDGGVYHSSEDVKQIKEDLDDVYDVMTNRITEDIYDSLTFTSGYMGKNGVIYSASTSIFQYSNKIPVKAGDIVTNIFSFRFVTAFSGDSAVEDFGMENVESYTVPDGITDIVVTIYANQQNVKIDHTHNVLIDVDGLKIDVDGLKTDVDGLKTDVDGLKTDVDEKLLLVYGYFDSTTLQYWDQTAQTIVYFKCKPNTKYTINKNETTPTFVICYIKEEPALGIKQPVYNYVIPDGETNVEYITGNDALYVLMLVGSYTDSWDMLKNNMSVTSKQIFLIDEKARTIISYDEAYLPNHLYMIVNKDYEIYHNQICPKSENYTFKWNSGNNYGNRVRLNYDSTGNKSLTCNIYNADGTLARQLSVTVHVVNAIAESIYLLPFGDSLTNHCVWESELMNMAENIVCVGSRSRVVNDSDGESRIVYDEGRAGFTSFNYTNGSQYVGGSDGGGDEAPHNKWYDPTTEKFSAKYYFENNFPSDKTAPNVMTIFLGMNDLLGTHTVDEIVVNMKNIIDDVLSYNSNMMIVLMTPQLRYLPSLNGYEHLLFLEYAEKMEKMASDYANIVFLPLLIGMDSVNNYNMNTVTINTRNTKTEETASDITHPASSGYWQIADYVLGAISYIASNISSN